MLDTKPSPLRTDTNANRRLKFWFWQVLAWRSWRKHIRIWLGLSLCDLAGLLSAFFVLPLSIFVAIQMHSKFVFDKVILLWGIFVFGVVGCCAVTALLMMATKKVRASAPKLGAFLSWRKCFGFALTQVAVTGVGLFLFVVPGVMSWLCFSLAVPHFVEEEMDLGIALRRAFSSMRVIRSRVILLVLAIAVALLMFGIFAFVAFRFFGPELSFLFAAAILMSILVWFRSLADALYGWHDNMHQKPLEHWERLLE